MVTFNDPALTLKVATFKGDFAGHSQLIRYGQFYLTERLIDDLLATVRTSIAANPLTALFPGVLENAMNQFQAAFRHPTNRLDAAPFNAIIDTLQLPMELKSLFAPTATATADVQHMYQLVWSNPEIGAAPPWVPWQPTLDRIKAADAYEKDKCFPVLRALAAKLLKHRGVASLPPSAKISDGAIAGAMIHGETSTGVDVVPQQVVRHHTVSALGSIYDRMRLAIDSKGLVQCGLLSGASHERSAFGSPEHYVMAFAHGTLANRPVFLCWDPDAAASNIGETTWGRGFTCLFALPDRLCTAFDAADLAGIELRKSAGTGIGEHGIGFGDHLNNPKRHSYQVYYVQTLPP